MKKVITLLIVVLVLGCAAIIAPTKQEIQNADYGKYPDNYQEIVKKAAQEYLFDPYTAEYLFESKPVKAYVPNKPIMPTGVIFGYGIEFKINAKNRYGGYSGYQNRSLFIKNDEVFYWREYRIYTVVKTK